MHARVHPEPSKGSSVSSETPAVELRQTEPSAARIVDAISAFPYTPFTATMDIVDNSVENGTSGVAVAFETTGKLISRITVADNGTGIGSSLIDEVLRAGSRTKHLYTPTSLSRFGVGLKGAGFALANRITVLTRADSGKLVRRSIDRARIDATDRWEQEIRQPTSAEHKLFEDSLTGLPGDNTPGSGTLVILEDVKLQTRDIAKLRTDLVRGAGETYCKFLTSSANGDIRRLRLSIDGVAVDPFDPLHRENPATILLIKREKIDFDDGTSAFFTAVSLPHPNTQPEEVVRRYRYMQKQQGVCVYRNGRLVRSGETFNLFSRDFHLNAFRAELEYDTSADTHFPVDVAKSTIQLDDEAFAKLKPHVTGAARTADTLWREKDVLTKEDISDLFKESNKLIGSRINLLVEAVNKRKNELHVRKIRRVNPTPPANGVVAPDALQTPKPRAFDGGYLQPADVLTCGVLYRPLLDGSLGGLVVEVNLSHPFAKAVFEVSPGETKVGDAKRRVPRRATTAMQQLLYVLGYCEFTMTNDEDSDDARMFEQFRRYVSMNLSALLE
jgi:hypothetical protein